MKSLRIILTIVLGCSTALTQVRLKGDFRISTDNSPSTFVHQYSSLFDNDTVGFIVTWQDNRNVQSNMYAQWFNAAGVPQGKNFPIQSYSEIICDGNNSFLCLYDQISSSYSEYSTVYGRIYSGNRSAADPFPITSFYVPDCGMGSFGTDYMAIHIAPGYLFFMREEGDVYVDRLSTSGNYLSSRYFHEIPFRVNRISPAVNSRSEYLLTCINVQSWSYLQDTMPRGIYTYFFDTLDSLRNSKYYPYIVSTVTTIAVSDSVFEIFWIDSDIHSLCYIKNNTKDKQIDSANTITLPATSFYRPVISLFKNGTFAVYICSNDKSMFYYFNSLGDLESSQFSNAPIGYLGTNIFRQGNETFYATMDSSDNVFLTGLRNFDRTSTVKINDDTAGSNEINPRITKIDDHTNFITWNNEIASKGRKFDVSGNAIGNEIALNGNQCYFSPDGRILNIWKKGSTLDSLYLYADIYDANWILLRRDSTVIHTAGASLNADVFQFSDSIFYLYYYFNNYVIIKRLNANFLQVGEKVLTYPAYFSIISFYKIDNNSFYLQVGGNIQKYTTDMTPTGESIDNFFASAYLGDGKFLLTQYHYAYAMYYVQTHQLYGFIRSIHGDTLVPDFYMAGNVDGYTLTVLPNNDFLLQYKLGNNLYARAFSPEGIARTDSFLIHDNVTAYRQLPSAVINANKIFFVWPDSRNEGRGYDIYCSIYDLKTLDVNKDNKIVPAETHVLQNYPNPFNASTRIQYSIARRTHVRMILYDILGKEIARLVDEDKPAGTYIANFDGSKLSSGLYFCKFIAGNVSEVKKLLLLR